jgi:hypothetical protein
MAQHMRGLVEGLESVHARQQRDDRAGGRRRLCTVPEAGDDRPHQCRDVGAPDAEGSAGEHRIGHARPDAGIADQAHQDEDEQRAYSDRQNEIDEAAAEQKQAGGQIVPPEAVHV